MSQRFKSNAIHFPGLADVSFADIAARRALSFCFQPVTPEERGSHIDVTRNLGDCSMRALVGPVIFPHPGNGRAQVVKRLEKLACWHANRNAREAALEMLGIDVEDIASSLDEIGSISSEYQDALITLDLESANDILDVVEWTNGAKSDAIALYRSMKFLKAVFEVQQTAAWTWGMLHKPYDGVLGEENYKGTSTIGAVRKTFDQRLAEFQLAHQFYRDGREKVGKSFRFLDQYGLGHLRKMKKRSVEEAFGAERIAALPEDLEYCAGEAERYKSIMDEIDHLEATSTDPLKFRRKQLDRFITGLPAITILAMRCASLAEALASDTAVQWNDAPQWLREEKSKHKCLSRTLFFNIFLFYRGVFVRDKDRFSLAVLSNECRSQEKIDAFANLFDPKKDQVRDIVRAMRECVAGGQYGKGPELPGRASAFAAKFGWRTAN